MNKKEYEKVVKSFNKYYEDYKDLSKGIVLKYGHSFNVANYMEELADKLVLDEEDIYLAKTIGLLHDIGRFEQLKEFNSFDDDKFDHADFSVKYLFEDGHIRDFIKDSKNDNIIKEAIANHNKYEIRDGLNERELLFSKMIRDMDKVDIFYQIASKYDIEFKDKPSDIAVKKFFEEKSLTNEERIKRCDYVIGTLAFVFDINFKESFEILKDSDNLGFYISCIDVSKENEELFNKMVEKCYEISGIGESYE